MFVSTRLAPFTAYEKISKPTQKSLELIRLRLHSSETVGECMHS